MKKLNIVVPSSVLKNGSDLEKEFFKDFNNNTRQFKLFLIMLAVYNFNLNNGISVHTLRLDGMNSKNNFLSNLKISKNEVIQLCNSMPNDLVKCNRAKDLNTIIFDLRKDLAMEILKDSMFVDFDVIKKFRQSNHITAYFKTAFFAKGNYNANLGYLCKLFGIKEEVEYRNKVSQVKRIFKAASCVKVEKDNKYNFTCYFPKLRLVKTA